MLRFSCLLIVLMMASARSDEPKLGPPVRTLLDAATKAKASAMAEVVRDFAKVEEEHLSDIEKPVKQQAIQDRYQSAVTQPFDRLLEAASGHPEDAAAVEALDFVAQNTRGLTTDQSRRALTALIRDHVRASNISIATRTLFAHEGKPEATALLRAVIAENPSRTERGRACEDLAWLLQFCAGRVERFRAGSSPNPLPPDLREANPASMKSEAAALYDRCVNEFADVPIIGYGAGKTVGDFARGALSDLHYLQVGQVAPEITGQDIDGKPLRLGDYRGKVVVLVFSGEWCGPCRGTAMYFRDLLKPEAQKINPCVVLEVDSDATRDPVRKAIGVGEITWPCWFDGGVTGPISMAWGVAEWPKIYVLDARGVIRAKDIRGEATADAVAEALKAQKPASQP